MGDFESSKESIDNYLNFNDQFTFTDSFERGYTKEDVQRKISEIRST
jgi:hypothetical protein